MHVCIYIYIYLYIFLYLYVYIKRFRLQFSWVIKTTAPGWCKGIDFKGDALERGRHNCQVPMVNPPEPGPEPVLSDVIFVSTLRRGRDKAPNIVKLAKPLAFGGRLGDKPEVRF